MMETIDPLSLAGLSILIIEDARELAVNLTSFFRLAGARTVDVRPDALSAQRRLKDGPAPDIVLIDYRLTGQITGTELATWMREQPHLEATLRVSFSSSSPEVVLSRAPDPQVYDAMIRKPMRLHKVVVQLSELSRRRAARPAPP